MIPYRSLPAWCHQGERDQFGLCVWAMLGNLLAVQTGQVMPPGEIENAARVMEGFNPYDPSTDHGERLEDVFSYVAAHGWPAEPTRRITDWRAVDFAGLPQAIADLGGAPSWLVLPMTEDGDDYDFSDDALGRNAEGIHPHAVLLVDVADGVTFPTWGALQTVSEVWARRYLRGCYRVEW